MSQLKSNQEDQEESNQELPATSKRVPDEMKKTPRWICFSVEKRGGKPTKLPRSPRTGEVSGVRSDEEFTSYEKAVDAAEERGFDGVGFVLSEEDDLAFVDLDNCILDGSVEEWAQDIVDTLDSYTAVSTSRTGLHVYLKGSLDPDYQNRHESIELYEDSRFLAFTGEHLDGFPTRCCERQDELLDVQHEHLPEDVLTSPESQSSSKDDSSFTFVTNSSQESLTASDEKVVETAKKYDDTFSRLHRGATLHSSDSESDLDYVGRLLFWTKGDTRACRRIWLNSGRQRPKLDRDDYVSSTISEAYSNLSDTYSGDY